MGPRVDFGRSVAYLATAGGLPRGAPQPTGGDMTMKRYSVRRETGMAQRVKLFSFGRRWCLAAFAGLVLVRGVATAADELGGLEGLYDSPSILNEESKPLIVFIDSQHPDVIREEMGKPTGHSSKIAALKEKFEVLAGVRCVALHQAQIKRGDFNKAHIKAILIGPRKRSIRKELDEEFFALIRDTRIPTIGFSTGHAMIAQAYGGKTGSMRDLKPGEVDAKPDFHPGKFKIWGPSEVRLLKPDPLFEGIEQTATFYEYHAFEIKELPAEFDALATSEECRYQAIRHKDKILYGTQFRPELYDAKCPEGETVVKNFFKLAGLGRGS